MGGYRDVSVTEGGTVCVGGYTDVRVTEGGRMCGRVQRCEGDRRWYSFWEGTAMLEGLLIVQNGSQQTRKWLHFRNGWY